jgi:hypothetical protein
MLLPTRAVGNQHGFPQAVKARVFAVLLSLTIVEGFAEPLHAQVVSFPYVESFDTVVPPALPSGWLTSANRSPGGDFTTTTSNPRSAPHAALSTNASISQELISPSFNFTNRRPEKLQFATARSSTHIASLVVEASLDNGTTFPILLGDTLRNPGVTSYVLTVISLPPLLANQPTVRFRWKIIGNPSGGSTATFRIDDISVTVLTTFDLALSQLSYSPAAPSPRDPISLSAQIRNLGLQPASPFSVDFFRDTNENRAADPSERFASAVGSSIAPSDSTIVTVHHPPLESGDHRFIAVVAWPQDENRKNDTASVLVSVGAERGSLIINEIMYEPLTGQNEWIELYNRSRSPINIARWRFTDRPTAGGSVNAFTITTQSRSIQPGDLVLLAADSTIISFFSELRSPPPGVHMFILNRSSGFSLNNDGDDIILYDAAGLVVDSVSYSPKWHHPDVTDTKGRSLERISPLGDSNDPRNWSTCAALAGGTPARQNSIFTSAPPSGATLSVSPNPFSPDGDGFQDFCAIRYNLPTSTAMISVKVFDIKGRLIRTLANSDLAGTEGEIIWDGMDDAKQRARIGPYIIYLEAVDARGGTVASAKAVVVVAMRL